MVSKQNPPSFRPKHSDKRPTIRGAKTVGTEKSYRSGNSVKKRPTSSTTTSPKSYTPANYPVNKNEHPTSTKSRINKTYPPVQPRVVYRGKNVDTKIRANTTPRKTEKPKNNITPINTASIKQIISKLLWANKRKKIKIGIAILVLLLIIPIIGILGWTRSVYSYGASQLNHVEALSNRKNTAGATYLIVGSDKRSTDFDGSQVKGQRSDTIMLLNIAKNGQVALISIPRDSYVQIPDNGANKINAAYSYGGPKLLVQTVEQLTGLTIDHYIEVGMDGIIDLTDAVGGINLCYDRDVQDSSSKLNWTAGCHDADGKTALAFSRMRYADPLGDIGRNIRQRQVVNALVKKAASKSNLRNPRIHKPLVGAVASNLTVDKKDTLWDMGMAGLNLRKAMQKDGLIGSPPISNLDYWPGGVGSAVQLDPEVIDNFWQDLRDGNLSSKKYDSLKPANK